MKLIHFFSKKEFENLGTPQPIKNFLPEWYRKSETEYDSGGGVFSPGLKTCVPVLDVMISGYALVTPVDIFVSKDENGELQVTWNGPQAFNGFVGERPKELGALMPRPAGHHPNHLVWSGFQGIRTPRGYSLLVSHPFNRYDLPFTTYSGLMDSDEFSASGNIPFFIKKDFVGTIPAGTPYAQLLPVKRTNWKMINNKGMRDLETIHGNAVRAEGKSYKKLMWHRKEYN